MANNRQQLIGDVTDSNPPAGWGFQGEERGDGRPRGHPVCVCVSVCVCVCVWVADGDAAGLFLDLAAGFGCFGSRIVATFFFSFSLLFLLLLLLLLLSVSRQ